MGSVLEVVQSPAFLGALLLLPMVSLIRLLLLRVPGLKRAHSGERRRLNGRMPATPFHDSDGVLVTENRRFQPDRRRARLLAMQHKMKQDNGPGLSNRYFANPDH